MATSIDAKGSISVTVAGQAGKYHRITRVIADGSGTLTLKDGSTTIWSASNVSGGLEVTFPNPKDITAGNSVTLSITGGTVLLLGQTMD